MPRPVYQEVCGKCDGGPFDTRQAYLQHLRREHSRLVYRIHRDLVVGLCETCEITYQTERGRCPGCEGGEGKITGGLEWKDGVRYAY